MDAVRREALPFPSPADVEKVGHGGGGPGAFRGEESCCCCCCCRRRRRRCARPRARSHIIIFEKSPPGEARARTGYRGTGARAHGPNHRRPDRLAALPAPRTERAAAAAAATPLCFYLLFTFELPSHPHPPSFTNSAQIASDAKLNTEEAQKLITSNPARLRAHTCVCVVGGINLGSK